MFEELLARIGECLKRYKIPYMIIDGQAVLLYGEPRLTRDIDITLGADTEQLDKVLKISKDLSLKPIPENIESFVKKTMVLPTLDESTSIRVDFIFSFTPYETQAIERSRKVLIMGQKVNFATPEDLIIHKIFAGRPRDMEDVRSILLKNCDIDKDYVREWLEEFNSSVPDRDLVKEFEVIAP